MKDADYPGLCMARSLGDYCVKAHGVICDPDVRRHILPAKEDKPFIVSP